MKKHLNTLFVTLEGCWLSKDGDTVKVNSDGACLLRVPLHNLEGIVTLGWDIGVSPYLMGACAERGDTLRGIEGSAAETYFSCLSHCQRTEDSELVFEGRNRRPPRDCFNALLSFLYSLLCHDARSALESSGIDAAAGFLHRDRPGRPGMALDLMEEFRAPLADRLALTLINRRQITADDFDKEESGAVFLKEDSRKKVLNAWQERKKTVLVHPFLQEKTTLGLLIHIQALLMARHLRGDLDCYPPFISK